MGNWGTNHKRILQELDVLEATCDTNGREDYRGLDDILSRNFDHAVVCSPPQSHYGIVKALLESGKHVFVEKPLTETADQCRELLSMASERRLKLQCGYIERFNPIVQGLELPRFSVFMRNNRKYDHVAGGIVMDTAVHDIDTALRRYGRCVSVSGIVEKDYCSITMECERGAASVNCSWLSGEKIRTINGISTVTSENILKNELKYFIQSDPIINVDWAALQVQEVIESIDSNL